MNLLRTLVYLMVLIPGICTAQKGFVITQDDSLYHGFMRFTSDGEGGQKLLITNDKKKKPREYRLSDLKFYAYKKDTIAVLRDFFPFEEDDGVVEIMEARVIVSKGVLKLYHGSLPITSGHSTVALVPTISPVGFGVMATRQPYNTFLIRTPDGQIRAIKHQNDDFEESILPYIEDNEALAADVRSGKLKFRDIKEIILRYNREK
jgi:hypothetical protein